MVELQVLTTFLRGPDNISMELLKLIGKKRTWAKKRLLAEKYLSYSSFNSKYCPTRRRRSRYWHRNGYLILDKDSLDDQFIEGSLPSWLAVLSIMSHVVID